MLVLPTVAAVLLSSDNRHVLALCRAFDHELYFALDKREQGVIKGAAQRQYVTVVAA